MVNYVTIVFFPSISSAALNYNFQVSFLIAYLYWKILSYKGQFIYLSYNVKIKYIRCFQGEYIKSEPVNCHSSLTVACDTGVCCDCVLNKNTRMFEKLSQYFNIYLAALNTKYRAHYQMLILKLRDIRSRVKSGSFNGMASPTNM